MMKNKNTKSDANPALLKLYRGTALGRATLVASGARVPHIDHVRRARTAHEGNREFKSHDCEVSRLAGDLENGNYNNTHSGTVTQRKTAYVESAGTRERSNGYSFPLTRKESFNSNTDTLTEFDFDADDVDPASVPGDTESNKSYVEETYNRMCKIQGITPCGRFKRQISCSVADVSNCMLGVKDIKSICVSLSANAFIKDLDLSGNDLSGKGAGYVAEALRENVSVDELTLMECNIDLNGLKAIAEVLLDMKPMKYLDISKNKFDKNHAEILAEVIKKNDYIEELVLAGNEFDETAGTLIGKALMSNVGIKKLDLSWNHLRRQGAAAVCMALRFNQTIEELDLSWNGLSMEGCKALGVALPYNHTLKSLDITCNRINIFDLRECLKGVGKNDTLNVLRIDQNPLTTDGAIGLMKCLELSKVSQITDVHMVDIPINGDFMDALDDLLKVRNVKVFHRDPNRKKIEPIIRRRTLKDYDPAMVLFEYMKQENLRLIDLFRTFDTDSSQSVSKTELKEGFTTINMPLTEDALESLFDKLDLNDNNEIEYDEYKVGYRKAMRKMRHGRASSNADDAESMNQLKILVKKAMLEKRESQAALRGQLKRKQRQSSLTVVFHTKDGKTVFEKLAEIEGE